VTPLNPFLMKDTSCHGEFHWALSPGGFPILVTHCSLDDKKKTGDAHLMQGVAQFLSLCSVVIWTCQILATYHKSVAEIIFVVVQTFLYAWYHNRFCPYCEYCMHDEVHVGIKSATADSGFGLIGPH
jgi:hypothetical protein